MSLKPLAQISTITLLSLGLLACSDDDSSDVVPTGTLSVQVTDAAVDDAEAVYVQFTGIAVKPKSGSAETLALSGDSQSCQDLIDDIDPVPTPDGEATIRCIELKELQGTDSANLLDGITLTAGEYNWMRLDVDALKGVMDSIIVLNDGTMESLYVPSGSQSGLKLNTAYTILAGGSHDFVIDFDLRKSVNNPQGFADYRLKPALRLVDLAESGNIAGSVDSTLLTAPGCSGDVNSGDGFAVYVYQGAGAVIGDEGSANAPLTSASVKLEGNSWDYTVGYLAPGEYTVAFTCQALDDSPEIADQDIDFVTSADSPTTVLADQDSSVNFNP